MNHEFAKTGLKGDVILMIARGETECADVAMVRTRNEAAKFIMTSVTGEWGDEAAEYLDGLLGHDFREGDWEISFEMGSLRAIDAFEVKFPNSQKV